MKAVLQRCTSADVVVDDRVTGAINLGLVILLCVEQGDVEEDCDYMARKSIELRIFADEDGKMNRSLVDVGGAVLLISQFTLAADWKKGRRPGFTRAAAPREGERLYEYFAAQLEKLGVEVQRGIFGAHMQITLCNDGPVTLILDHQFAGEPGGIPKSKERRAAHSQAEKQDANATVNGAGQHRVIDSH